MSIKVKVPELPESVADAVVAAWHKKPGETIRRDETLVDLETDKVILEVPATQSGVVKELKYAQGDTVTANQVLAIIEEAEVTTAIQTDQQAVPAKQTADTAISPSARKLMQENKLDESMVTGSGKGGRILKEDVMKLLQERAPSQQPVQTAVSEKTAIPQKKTEASSQQTTNTVKDKAGRVERRVPMTRLRARIAERLLQAQHNAAILTTFNEVNMKPVMDLRARYKEKFEKDHGVRLGFMSFFVRAVVESLKQFPVVNASIDGDDVVYHGFFDIGVAVSSPSGLVVPILRDADTLSLAQIEQSIVNYANAAKQNNLTMDDINGGTFTISNGGVFGSMLSTPILNPPQSAILGMHTIKQRAMVVDGNIEILPMMYLALSYDHRIIDGREAVSFLVSIRDSLEDPSRMLLGV